MTTMGRILLLLLLLVIVTGCGQGQLTKVSISESQGFGEMNDDFFAIYTDKAALDVFQHAITTAVQQEGVVDVAEPEFDLQLVKAKGQKSHYYLWLGQEGQKGSLMAAADTHTLYTLTEEAAVSLRTLLSQETKETTGQNL